MKRMVLALVAMLAIQFSANAMSYEQARDQALFLTDKMAYELNLTEDQYEAAYEVNLDYLMRVNTVDDLYGVYWTQRNLDLSYIMLDWQFRQFCEASYFYRPLWWDGGYWHFGIYARYPHRTYFYFGHPTFVTVYRGGHSWYNNGGHSWYNGRQFARMPHDGGRYQGMRDGYQRGDYKRGFGNGRRLDVTTASNRGAVQPGSSAVNNGSRQFGNGSRQFGGTSASRSAGVQPQSRFNRGSSTRETVRNGYSGGRLNNFGSAPSRSFTPSNSSRISSPSSANSSRILSSPRSSVSSPSRSYSAPSSSYSSPSRSFGGGASSSRSFGGGNSGSRSFGGGSHSFGGHR